MTSKLPSKIFIDGGDPVETAAAHKLLGFLDGQTTNPTLIAKNLAKTGVQLSQEKALDEYERIVRQINKVIPKGSISIQVFADQTTAAVDMLVQARTRNRWISNASIKFPCTSEGLKAAAIACQEMAINITLVFSQSQAAAVYEATKKATHPVFISPFVGRLDDRGENGMDVVKNIIQMYKDGDGHVEVLTASVRNIEHILYGLKLKSNIITIPFKVLSQWATDGFRQPSENYIYNPGNLTPIPYREDITLGKSWDVYDLSHPLTDKGILAFWSDWMGLFS